MILKFNCPRCKKLLKVKEELGGKKARCPGCKQLITIPAPAKAPADGAADLEALAAAAFSDPPPAKAAAPEPARPTGTIDFPCPFCDEPMHVSAELSGKQAPCPECGRIVKVPLLVKNEAKDWRTADTRLPSGAKRETAPAPEGAWGTATSAGTVSREALVEADAVPEEVEPVTVGQWVKRGLVLGVAVAVVGGATWAILGTMTKNREQDALRRAQDFLPPDGKRPHPSPEGAAEVFRGMGEFSLRAGKPDEAAAQFSKARAQLDAPGGPDHAAERDAVLIDLAGSQVELAGTPPEVTARTRWKWDRTDKELHFTLQKVGSAAGRIEAVRQVGGKLIARDQGNRAATLAALMGPDGEAAERKGVIGLQLLKAGQNKAAESLAGQAAQPFLAKRPAANKDVGVSRLPSAPSLVALLVALGQEEKAKGIIAPPPSGRVPALDARLAYVQGWAHQGKYEQARQLAEAPGAPADRLEALVALAAVEGDKDPNAARPDLEKASNLVTGGELRGTASAWVLLRLVQMLMNAGMADRAQAVLENISDPDFRGRAYLEWLRPQLKDAKKAAELLKLESKQAPAYPPVWEAIARANARRGNVSSTLKAIAGWDETLQPFGYVGVALGVQDNR